MPATIRTFVIVLELLAVSMVLITPANAESTPQQQEVWIDVRTWVEHQVDHIEGDVRIHVSDLAQQVPQQFPDKDTPIRLYCAAGVRAQRGVEILTAAGYRNVLNAGGIAEARAARQTDLNAAPDAGQSTDNPQ